MLNGLISRIVTKSPRFWVNFLFHDIWIFRNKIQSMRKGNNIPKSYLKHGWKLNLYNSYWESYGSFIGIDAILEEKPRFPHKPLGVFISNSAHIGKRCVIFHQVTIGSNTIIGSKGYGAPYLEDGVYIGCGAKIIGKVHVGKNARIGANCVIVKDVSENSVSVIRGIESIVKHEVLDNLFISNSPVL